MRNLAYKVVRLKVSDLMGQLTRVTLYLYMLHYFLWSVTGIKQEYLSYLLIGIVAFALVNIFFGMSWYIPLFTIWYFILFAWSSFSKIYTLNPIRAAESTRQIFNMLLIGTSIISVTRNYKDIIKLIRGIAVCGLIIFMVLYSTNQLHLDDRLGRTLTNNNTNAFAMYIMLTLICSIGLYFLDTQKKSKFFVLIMIFTETYMLFLSGGRKFIICPVVLITLISLMSIDKNNAIKLVKSLIGITAIIILLYYLIMKVPYFYNTIGYRFVETGTDGSSVQRIQMIKEGWLLFLSSPIIGHGESSYMFMAASSIGREAYSHNNYIELLANLGIVGFCIYYSYFILIISKLYKARQTGDKMVVFFFALMISFLVLDMTVVSYVTSSLPYVFCGIAGVCVKKNNGISIREKVRV